MAAAPRSDDEYREEIAGHIELETRANVERGMSPDEARRRAHVAFGSVAGVRQELHEGRSDVWRSTLARDVRYGVRMIRRNWLVSGFVALIMSVGIGSATAVFSNMNAIAFAPPVVNDPASFVLFIDDEGGFGQQVATTERYERLRRETRTLRELAAWSIVPLGAPIGTSDSSQVQGALASCNLFEVFSNLPPLAGRFLRPDDCESAVPVAVISRDLWRSRFGGDPGVVGKGINYGGHSVTVVGVAAPPATEGATADLWLPYTVHTQVKDLMEAFGGPDPADPEFYWLAMAGRLATGVSRRAASAEFDVLLGREELPNPDFVVGLKLTDGSLWSVAPLETLWMFSAALAFPMLFMLIVCATVATLLLSRAAKRQREMAIRLAVGGRRFGLLRMLLVENLLLSGIAAVVALALVYGLGSLVRDTWFGLPGGPLRSAPPDWRVLAFMGLTTIIAALCAGLAPAMESLNVHLAESMKGKLVLSGRSGVALTRGFLVGVQVAFSMVLLVTAAALIRAERRVAQPGFETRQVMIAELPQKSTTAQTQVSLGARIESLPAVRSTAFSESLPLVFESAIVLDDPNQPRRPVLSARVSPAYFDTLGIRILSGRTFDAGDSSSVASARPVVVSQRFAERAFPGQNPIGRTFAELGPQGAPVSLEIIGVAANRAAGFGPMQTVNDGSFVYRLMEPSLKGYLFVRFDGNATAFTLALQDLLKQATGWVVPVTTLRARLDRDPRKYQLRRFQTLLTTLGAVGLMLALIGVFGIVAFAAIHRRKEIAIRTALGAHRSDVVREMVLPALRPIGAGILGGAFLSFVALRFAEQQRVVPLGLPSMDPLAYLGGGLVVLCAALVAMSPPATRAAGSDPARALRED